MRAVGFNWLSLVFTCCCFSSHPNGFILPGPYHLWYFCYFGIGFNVQRGISIDCLSDLWFMIYFQDSLFVFATFQIIFSLLKLSTFFLKKNLLKNSLRTFIPCVAMGPWYACRKPSRISYLLHNSLLLNRLAELSIAFHGSICRPIDKWTWLLNGAEHLNSVPMGFVRMNSPLRYDSPDLFNRYWYWLNTQIA